MPENNFVNPSVIAAETLVALEDELVAGQMIYNDKTVEFNKQGGYAVGDSIDIKTYTELTANEFTQGGTITTQGINDSKTSLAVEKHFDTSVEVSNYHETLNLDGVQEQIAQPAAKALAHKIEPYLLSKITQAQGLYVSSNLLETPADIAQMNKRATRQQISKSGRICLINDELEATLLGSDWFVKSDHRDDATPALREASLGKTLSNDFFASIHLPEETRTPVTAAGVLDNSGDANRQGMSSLKTDATTGTFTAGDKIKVAGAKRYYTVATTTAAGATSIPLVEEINENLSELDNAAISVISAGTQYEVQGIQFIPGAFSYTMPPLAPMAGQESATISANGMSVRVTKGADIKTKETIWSFDVLVGASMTDRRKAQVLGKSA